MLFDGFDQHINGVVVWGQSRAMEHLLHHGKFSRVFSIHHSVHILIIDAMSGMFAVPPAQRAGGYLLSWPSKEVVLVQWYRVVSSHQRDLGQFVRLKPWIGLPHPFGQR